MTLMKSMQPAGPDMGAASPALETQPAAAAVPTPGVAACPGRLSELYDVQKPVGKGGYAVVYKAVRKLDGRVVAVKRVEVFEMSQKKRERCLQEVTLLAQLNHPYIIQMLDAFIDENMLIIIFEWAPAGDLKRMLKKTADAGKTLDEPAIWGYFSQIVDGLRCMHAHRIMHRDIKPANVLVGANGSLKLGDLGLGRQLSHQTMEAFSKVGTPYYVSPEVVRGAGYDWKSDVWSLGCLLYELACLKSPFEMEGANLYDVFQRISKADYAPLPSAQFSPTLTRLVARMLSVDPTGRPDLEEVWRISQSCLNAQASSRVGLHVAAEVLHAQLVLLESVVAAAAAAVPPGSLAVVALDARNKDSARSSRRRSSASKAVNATSSNSAVGSTGSKQDSSRAAAPPSHVLRALHPAFFAEAQTGHLAATGLGTISTDEAQKQQLGSFLAIFAWLLHVAGWPDLAASVEQWLQVSTVPVPPAARSVQHFQLQASIRGSSKHPSSSQKQAGQHAKLSPAPPGSRKAGNVTVCTNILQGAEAVKLAAQAIGLPTEFAPVSALAAGHGRAVCSLLQDLLDITLRKVPLVLAAPVHAPEPECTEGDTLQGEDEGCNADESSAVLTKESQMPASYVQSTEDDGLAVDDLAFVRRAQGSGAVQPCPPQSRGGISKPGHDRIQHGNSMSVHPVVSDHRPQGQQRPSPAHASIHAQVDAVAWKQEAERLAPQLSRITVSSAAMNGMAPSDWWPRWQKLRQASATLQQQAGGETGSHLVTLSDLEHGAPTNHEPGHHQGGKTSEGGGALMALQKLGRDVSAQLEQVELRERRIAGSTEVSQLLQVYASKRERQQELQKDITAQEELQQLGHEALTQLGSRMHDVQFELEQKALQLDGAASLQQMRAAITMLQQEIQRLDVRAGTLQSALLARQRKQSFAAQHELRGPSASNL